MAQQKPIEGWGVCAEPPRVHEERLRQEAELIKQAQMTGTALEESLAARLYKRRQKRAHQQLHIWIKRTGFQRPEACEICGATLESMKSKRNLFISMGATDDVRKKRELDAKYSGNFEHSEFIIGHHWRGYEHPLDVWWICYSCNSRLWGKHDGSLSIEEARQYVKQINVRSWHQPDPEWESKVRQLLEFEKTNPGLKSLREFARLHGILYNEFD